MQSPALSHPNFRRLVAGTTTSALGNAITPVALAFAVLDLGGSATQLGLVEAAYALTNVLTTLFGGVLGDRVPRALMLQGSALGASLTQAFIAASLIGGWSSVLLIGLVGMLNGSLSALSGPSSAALTRQTVPEEVLPSAVALRRLLQNVAMVIGFAGAGIIVAFAGAGWAIALDAVTFAVAAYCFHRLDVPALLGVGTGAPSSMLTDLAEGAREVLRHTWLWMLILQATLYHLFYGGVQGVLGPIAVRDAWDEAAWGWALAALMTGFMAGGLVSLRFRPRRGLFVGTLMLALTACFPAAIALGDSLVVLLLGAFLHGFGLEIFSVNWDLSIQQNIAPDKLARVYSFDLMGSFLARPLGLALVGPVSAATGLTTWLWVCAAVMAGGSLVAATLPAVRRLQRAAPYVREAPR
ncbi:MFS transporter [Nocardioides houyundeii]|uniref:MFS transporter n=1 Tax=Nocardioides houyundeii TaxID=2045452 RepID=UPI000DF348D3|nr:MFS transporter [Nocardioides houyundeii]